ncbi:orotidine-5'-phosphate decarboxylase [Alkalicoccus urumqiensis]|uniref:Orotidine 5'-phosphate decarboxylase n=1 Tax=Alkalicoccus urumqiensis TaxID=1548213 RepID=A0A2P6MG91_ALKUR|nr:orotidine-5'-phosphate decarboxylase [Alkalicoccus urumqiensis]PRO65294.1 orotidine-5'-phosphate decarboxylase [Alkalicoccus urumqiensis]
MHERPLIVAVDVESAAEAETLTSKLPASCWLKVGMELFYREGPDPVRKWKEKGHPIFLDLKLHDIPETVKRGMKNLAQLEPEIVNVHAFGGQQMMEAALEGLDAGTAAGKKRPRLIAVTQLTSTSEQEMKADQNISGSLRDHVLFLAGNAQRSGLDGVVCSAHEAEAIRQETETSFMTIAPGIRRKEDAAGDQKRIMTPKEAGERGVTGIVVGRGITKSVDPAEAYYRYEKEWEHGKQRCIYR